MNKHVGGDFREDLLEFLRDEDEAVLVHLEDALKNPHMSEDKADYEYLKSVLQDIEEARIPGTKGNKGVSG